jgi:hypothetical protein
MANGRARKFSSEDLAGLIIRDAKGRLISDANEDFVDPKRIKELEEEDAAIAAMPPMPKVSSTFDLSPEELYRLEKMIDGDTANP